MIVIETRLIKDGEKRLSGALGAAVIVLQLEGPLEVWVPYGSAENDHRAAEIAVRDCRRGMGARVAGTHLTYRTDHGEATHVLRNVTQAVVAGRSLL